jgi:hypothetical protein
MQSDAIYSQPNVDVEATLPAGCEMMLLIKKYPDDAKNQ